MNKLSKSMKSSSKPKSPECLLKTTRKGNVLEHMTSTSHKRSSNKTYQESFSDTTRLITISHEDISGIVPLDSCVSRSSLLDLTPRITISDCENKHKASKGEKTVQRKKIKSPVNKKALRRLEPKSKIEEYESQLKKKSSEIFSLTRKVNVLQETLNDKNRLVRDLEMKFPKMLSELSRGLGKDPEKLKVSLELKETMKRNRQLSGNQKRNEDLLRNKEDKIKLLEKERDKALEELRAKEKESKDFKSRLVSAEQRVSLLAGKLDVRDSDLKKCKEKLEDLQYRYRVINEENFSKIIQLEKMSSEICALSECNEEKDNQIEKLKHQTNGLVISLNEESLKSYNLEIRLKELLDQQQQPRDSRKSSDLNDVTKEMLDKITSVAKDNKMLVNVQLTVNQQSREEVPSRGNLPTLTSENVCQYEELGQEEYLEVFEEESSTLSLGDLTVASNMSEAEYNLSAGTLAKAEELDEQVRSLWSRLSCPDATLDYLQGQHQTLEQSVSRLRNDLDQSIKKNDKLQQNVTFAKKLFK